MSIVRRPSASWAHHGFDIVEAIFGYDSVFNKRQIQEYFCWCRRKWQINRRRRAWARPPSAESTGYRAVGAAGVRHAGSGWGVGYGSSPTKCPVGESTSGFAGLFNGNVRVNDAVQVCGRFHDRPPARPCQQAPRSTPSLEHEECVRRGATTTNPQGLRDRVLPTSRRSTARSAANQLTIVCRQRARGEGDRAQPVQNPDRRRRVKVSWQVTGIWCTANAHRIKVVQAEAARGARPLTRSCSCTGSQARRACSECPAASALGR